MGLRAGLENFAPTGIRSPDRPARRQSLYQLRYPAPQTQNILKQILFKLFRYSINLKQMAFPAIEIYIRPSLPWTVCKPAR